ncbi:MAG: hypothetical protein KAS65_00355 [Candidatus Aminicenantes bacterium]|nr:hypothetical protein [Candidatus Aminicenantes bacterium]
MAKSKTITVTKNVKYCLDTLKKAVDALPAGDQKKEASDAIKYMKQTAEGKAQIRRGNDCNFRLVIPPHLLKKTNKFYKPKS